MRRAHSRNAPRQNLSALRNKLKQEARILVVDVIDFVHAELADLFSSHELSFWTPRCCGFSHECHVSVSCAIPHEINEVCLTRRLPLTFAKFLHQYRIFSGKQAKAVWQLGGHWQALVRLPDSVAAPHWKPYRAAV